MKRIEKIEVLGDSILKGVQVNPENKRYYTKNDIDFCMLGREYALDFQNDSNFGCTVTKGARILDKKLEQGLSCDAVIMDFGGNDCDFIWSEISDNPEGTFQPRTPLPQFLEEYTKIIRSLREKGIIPILTTLPPLEPQRFFDWWCAKLNKKNIMKWLGTVETIFYHQENYSKQVELLAVQEGVPLIDIRAEFMKNHDIGGLICEDGTHPNSSGQAAITRALQNFLKLQFGTNLVHCLNDI